MKSQRVLLHATPLYYKKKGNVLAQQKRAWPWFWCKQWESKPHAGEGAKM